MRYLIWDFDETLAYRTGKWSGTLVEVLRREIPEHPCTIQDIRPYMQTGYPWSQPEKPHSPLRSADEWWEDRLPMLENVYRQGAKLPPGTARQLARLVRAAYIHPDAWRLFDDALPTLLALRNEGWHHLILSNHEPHPEAFRTVLNTLRGAKEIWMIGDSVSADIGGAKAVGVPAILVRSQHPDASHCCDTLAEIRKFLQSR